jgi:hypothetical protein
VLSSLEFWERTDSWWRHEFTVRAIEDWTRINKSFLEAGEESNWVKSWRLEDAVADPDGFIDDAAALLQVDPGELDRTVVERPIYDYTGSERKRELTPFEELPRKLRMLLRSSELRSVAEAYGYKL